MEDIHWQWILQEAMDIYLVHQKDILHCIDKNVNII